MTLRRRLTIWSVVVMALLVGATSALDLAHNMQREFEEALERAELLMRVSVDMVLRSLDREPHLPIREALARDARLGPALVDTLTASHALVEIAICDRNHQILVGSDPARVGSRFVPYPNFRPLATRSGPLRQFRVLLNPEQSYQLEESLGTQDQNSVMLYVRVVISPALIRRDIMPILRSRAELGGISILGA
ncbi:MAG: hypothetical protein FJW37_13765, partial [Acidobacteria bacterium]|nr:hypothetical protein [Acidobacteriota bacterium]